MCALARAPGLPEALDLGAERRGELLDQVLSVERDRAQPVEDAVLQLRGDRQMQAVLTAKGVELVPADTLLTAQLAYSLRDLKEFVPISGVTVERALDNDTS